MEEFFTVNLPDIGEGVVEGEVIEWLKKIGDPLNQDEPVVVVMTDKATVELPAPHPGVLSKQYYKPGEIAHKGKPLYEIGLAAPLAKTEKKQPVQVASKEKEAVKSAPTLPQTPKTSCTEKALATPPVRKLAKEMGIDLNAVEGTGKQGRVTVQDLQRSNVANQTISDVLRLPDDEVRAVHGIRLLMAKKMTESHSVIPQFSYFEQVDASRLVQMKNKFKETALKEGIHLTYMPFFIRALALTVKKYPILNSSFDVKSQSLLFHKHFNIGIAISTQYGLIVPVIKDVQDLSMNDLIRVYEKLKIKALENKLSSNDMKEATITISNYGALGGGGRWATPIINYPEVAILAVARIQKEPIVKDDEVLVKEILHTSWSFDHRVIDGDLGASCSHYYSQIIQNPAQLL